eukprot:GABV01009760.1.p1 GENE.GABV01009760.1~~GABV01009760.1.p1  ORF type:complete len:122 (+),score=48.13 GABV01009760.1:214-579(+)
MDTREKTAAKHAAVIAESTKLAQHWFILALFAQFTDADELKFESVRDWINEESIEIEHPSDRGDSPLIAAVCAESVPSDVVRALLSFHGVRKNVDFPGYGQRTALFQAASREIVLLWLKCF